MLFEGRHARNAAIARHVRAAPLDHFTLQTPAAFQILLRHAIDAQIAGGLRLFTVTQAKRHEWLLRLVRANVREPVQVEGDLYALVACNEVGGRRLNAMMAEYRLKDIEALGEFIITQIA